MNRLVQTIRLTSQNNYGHKAPPAAVGEFLRQLPAAVRQSIAMGMAGRSVLKGRQPTWLKAASDIRFVGYDGDSDTVLCFEAPSLGEAAEEVYRQPEFWPTRPDPGDTGFDLLGDVLTDVAAEAEDSQRFDRQLLIRVSKFQRGFSLGFDGLYLTGHRYSGERPAALTPATVGAANRLFAETPIPQPARIVGRLDMLRASTKSFGILLDDGQEIRGVLTDGDVEEIASLLNQRVVVLGKAVYRPSGRLLRVDAEEVSSSADAGSFFSAIPKPVRSRFDLRETVRQQQNKTGVAAIIGKWPGDESDEEVERALEGLS